MTHFRSAVTIAVICVAATAAHADLSISSKLTQNMSCNAGVCTATAAKAVLNAGDLATMLAGGDVAVKTGTLAKDIAIDQPLSWSSTSRLSLDARRSVTIKKQVTVAGTGALTITTNDDVGARPKSKNGEFIIVPEHGSVQFWGKESSLIIDGNSYVLVDDIKTLASDIAANPSGFYALAKPYDASRDGTYPTSPVSTGIRGIFEGLGNPIASVSINSTVQGDLVGLFVGTEPEGVLRHVMVKNAAVSARLPNGIALLVGGSSGQVIRCEASGRISFPLTVGAGGLVSENDGVIVGSAANAHLAGTGANRVGGLADSNYGSIVASYALGSLVMRSSSQSNVGGLVGNNFGTVENSFARNHVNDGKQNSNSSYGGLVGENEAGGQVESSYAAGKVSIHSGVTVGGLVGADLSAPGNLKLTRWDFDMGISDPHRGAGNVADDPGIRGLTTKQLKSGLPRGFDPKVWGSDPNINNGYPYLLANPPR